MLEWIRETQDVWQRLQNTQKPIVMYGMGDGAVKILQVMKRYGVAPAAMFASDGFARGNLFMGYKMEELADIQSRYDDFLIVVAFAVHDEPTVNYLYELSQKYELVAPDVPVAGTNLFTMDFVQEHEQEFLQVESMLADEQSRKVLYDIVNFKLSGKLYYLADCTTDTELTIILSSRQRRNLLPILVPTAEIPLQNCCIMQEDAGGYLHLSRMKRPTKNFVLQ